ncbi:MAG: hypothetical protein FWF87_05855 [Synergistaceae bacterium]|nr:hypothetical protein [Synergistaceae bacterium]
MKKVIQLFMIFMLVFLLPATSTAAYFNFNPKEWIIHDDVADKRAREELLSRQGPQGFKPFSDTPEIPFGGHQTISATEWPESMRKAMDGPNGMPQDVKDWFKTPAFDYSPGKHTLSEDLPGNIGYFTTQQEMIDWFETLPKTRMKYQLVTGFPYFTVNQNNGYNDYALARTFELILSVFSIPSVFTPDEVKALGKPVVWLHGQIHGDETSSGEALLQVAKEFAEGKHDDILSKVTVVIVPRFNVDGAWNNQRHTTGAFPFGLHDADMNRDFVAFETPIVRAIRQLQIAYDPIVSLCGHEQSYTFDWEEYRTDSGGFTRNGYYRGYDAVLATTMSYNLNVDKHVRDLGFNLFEPATKAILEEKKVGWNRYVGGSINAELGHGTFATTYIPTEVVSSNGVTGPIPGRLAHWTGETDFVMVPDEGIGVNGAALGNQSLAFVHEASKVGNGAYTNTVRLAYLRRTYAHYLGALEICRTAANNLGIIMPAVNAARAAEIAGTAPLSFWGRAPIPVSVKKNVFEYKSWKKEDSAEVVNAIGPGTRDTMWIYAHFAERDTNAQVTRPIAYIIPSDHYEAAIRLFYSGVKLERLTRDQTVQVEAYTVTSTGLNDLSPSGPPILAYYAIRSVTKATKAIAFPKDSFVVRMDQLGASLAGLALEPMAIRNYGNMYLSRIDGEYIPTWYHDTFLPVSTGREFPCYRYVSDASNPISTYPASMNLPLMLTMVEKVHALTQEEIAEIKDELGLAADPEYISKFQLPALSADVYKNMVNVDINEAFMLPDGTVIYIDPDNVLDGNIVKIAAPKGLNGNLIFAGKKGGGYSKIFEKNLVPVSPEDILKDGKAPDGAQIINKKLVWTTPFENKGVILANSMLGGYEISYVEPVAAGAGYTLEYEGDKVVAYFDSLTLVDGTAGIYLVKDGGDPAAGYDALIIVEFKGKKATGSGGHWRDYCEELGCNAFSQLFILFAIIPFMAIVRKKGE